MNQHVANSNLHVWCKIWEINRQDPGMMFGVFVWICSTNHEWDDDNPREMGGGITNKKGDWLRHKKGGCSSQKLANQYVMVSCFLGSCFPGWRRVCQRTLFSRIYTHQWVHAPWLGVQNHHWHHHRILSNHQITIGPRLNHHLMSLKLSPKATRKITMKPISNHYITIQPPSNHHEIRIDSQRNHDQVTIKSPSLFLIKILR